MTPMNKAASRLHATSHSPAVQHLVVFFGAAGIGAGGGWGADAVLRACCKVVCRPRGTDQRRGRVVLVDEHRTTQVSSAVNGQHPCEEELDHEEPTRRADWKPQQGSSQAATQPAGAEPGPSTPLPAKRSKRTKAEPAAEPTQLTKGKGKAKGKAAKAKPAPQPGRWLDRDCNAALNMQRIGESRWRSLELCHWPDQGALPAKGKEYPGLGCKRLRDKPPMAQQQQQQPVKAQHASATNILNDAGPSTTSKARSHLSKAVGHDVDSRPTLAQGTPGMLDTLGDSEAQERHYWSDLVEQVKNYTSGPEPEPPAGRCAALHGIFAGLMAAFQDMLDAMASPAPLTPLRRQELRDAVVQLLAQWAACNKKLRQKGALDIKEAEYLVSKFHSPGMMRLFVDVGGAMQLPGRTKLPSFTKAHQAASFKQALGLYEWLSLHSQGEAFQQDARKAAEETKAQAAMIATWNVECKAKGDSDGPSGPRTMLRMMASHGLYVIALQELNDPVEVQAMLEKARDAGLVGYTLYMPDDDVMVKSGYLTARRGQKGGFLCRDGHVQVLKCWSDSLVRFMTPEDHEELTELMLQHKKEPDAYMKAGSNIVDMAVMLVGGQPTLFLSCHLAADKKCKVQRDIQARAMVQLHRKLLEEHPELASMPAVMMGDFNTPDPKLSGWEKATMKADCAKSLPMEDEHVDHLYLWRPTTPSSDGSLPQAVWLTEAETINASIGTQLGVKNKGKETKPKKKNKDKTASPAISEEKAAQREKARLLTKGKNEAWHQLGVLSASNHNPCVAALGLPKQPTHTSEQLQTLRAACLMLGPLKLQNKL
ncbi:hypothetical protein QJQ45_007079 [Haematococcus lacustris]|nr:hypothetical protein QJQ45_007079 [Haematococcus lacustris]